MFIFHKYIIWVILPIISYLQYIHKLPTSFKATRSTRNNQTHRATPNITSSNIKSKATPRDQLVPLVLTS